MNLNDINFFDIFNIDKYVSHDIEMIEFNRYTTNIRRLNIPSLGIQNVPIPEDFIIMVNDYILDVDFDHYLEGNMTSFRIINKRPKISNEDYDESRELVDFYSGICNCISFYIANDKNNKIICNDMKLCVSATIPEHFIFLEYDELKEYYGVKDFLKYYDTCRKENKFISYLYYKLSQALKQIRLKYDLR